MDRHQDSLVPRRSVYKRGVGDESTENVSLIRYGQTLTEIARLATRLKP